MYKSARFSTYNRFALKPFGMFSLSLTLGIVSTLLKISVFCSVFFIVASFFCLVYLIIESIYQPSSQNQVIQNELSASEALSHRSSLSSLSSCQDGMSETTRQQNIDEWDISLYLPKLNKAMTLSRSILSILNEPDFHSISAAAKKNIVNSAKDPSTGQTALMVAIQAENPVCVDRLIALGADVNAQDNSNKTVLDYAIEVDNKPIINSLLSNGAIDLRGVVMRRDDEINDAKKIVEGVAKGYENTFKPLFISTAQNLEDAVDKSDQTQITEGLETYQSLLDLKDFQKLTTDEKAECLNIKSGKSHWNALMFAANEGNNDLVSKLIEAGADVNARSRSKMTPLMFAAQQGHLAVVETLIEKGADPSLKMRRRRGTALDQARAKNHDQVVNYLEQNSPGSGRVRLLKALSENPAEEKMGKDLEVNSETFMVAIQAKNHACVDRLIALGADVNAQDNSNKTVLDYATEVNDQDIITSLLSSNGAHATSEGFGSWV